MSKFTRLRATTQATPAHQAFLDRQQASNQDRHLNRIKATLDNNRIERRPMIALLGRHESRIKAIKPDAE